MIRIDTREAVEKFIKYGFSREQANVTVEVFKGGDSEGFATELDLELLRKDSER